MSSGNFRNTDNTSTFWSKRPQIAVYNAERPSISEVDFLLYLTTSGIVSVMTEGYTRPPFCVGFAKVALQAAWLSCAVAGVWTTFRFVDKRLGRARARFSRRETILPSGCILAADIGQILWDQLPPPIFSLGFVPPDIDIWNSQMPDTFVLSLYLFAAAWGA